MRLFLEQQWSHEQIANRLAYENHSLHISYNTTYRAIYAGLFDTEAQKRSKGTGVQSETKALNGLQFCLPDPHAPWQRGTSEGTNGLLREYLAKSFDIALSSQSDITDFINKLFFRPCKCLAWKTPHEVFFYQSLHLTLQFKI